MHASRLAHRAGIVAALAVSLGCATARPHAGLEPGSPAAHPAARHDRDVITVTDAAGAGARTAWEAVARLRPELLRRRGAVSPSDETGGLPVVYVNGIRQGSPEMLRSIAADVILDIHYYTPAQAIVQLGYGHPGGVLAVRLRPLGTR
jgi:hypothetical protein